MKLSKELWALAYVPELLEWASHFELHAEQAEALEQRQARLEATIDAGIIASLESNATAAQVRIVMRAVLEEHEQGN